MDENSVNVLIQINSNEYEFGIEVDEWDQMTTFEKDEFLTDCEMEARERYCASRTWVSVTRPDGTEVEI